MNFSSDVIDLWVVANDAQVLDIKVGRIRRSAAATAAQHLVVNDEIEASPDVIVSVLGRDELVVHVEARLDRGPVVLGAQLDLDGVPGRRRGRVRHVRGRDLGARVERVERDLARALPLGQVDLRRPALDGGQPERRPRALGYGRDKVGLEV